MMPILRDLIFDFGMHVGEDTAFYLKKGFKVVAIEANAELCARARTHFRTEIATDQLRIVEAAIAERDGMVTFYQNQTISSWGTVNPEWAARNKLLGTESRTVEVTAVALETLIRTYGVPYYIKVDIEGSDRLCLDGLSRLSERPSFVSFEVEEGDITPFVRDVETLEKLGYETFQLVPQHNITAQQCPKDTREGIYTPFTFPEGSTGLFGLDLPSASWVSRTELVKRYKRILFKQRIFGHRGLLRAIPGVNALGNLNRTASSSVPRLAYQVARATLDCLHLRPGHYDVHARLTQS